MPLWKARDVTGEAAPARALFLDRDGVIIEDRHYLADPEQVVLLPGVPEAMIRARDAGFLLVGVSNQSGIGRERFTEAEFQAVMARLDALLNEAGAGFDAFLFCPHGPDAGCPCRKPLPGMLDEFSRLRPWRKEGSWVIGDKISDVQLGRDAGLGACLVRTGYGAESETGARQIFGSDRRVLFADDLPAALDRILTLENGAGA